MTTAPEAWQAILDELAKVRAGWPGGGWSWDGRFKCVAASFEKPIEERVRTLTAATLGDEWTAESLGAAPAEVRALAERYGGLRTGQSLLTGVAAEGGARLFGFLWPWGDGTTISLRLGVANVDQPTERYPQLRALFGIK